MLCTLGAFSDDCGEWSLWMTLDGLLDPGECSLGDWLGLESWLLLRSPAEPRWTLWKNLQFSSDFSLFFFVRNLSPWTTPCTRQCEPRLLLSSKFKMDLLDGTALRLVSCLLLFLAELLRTLWCIFRSEESIERAGEADLAGVLSLPPAFTWISWFLWVFACCILFFSIFNLASFALQLGLVSLRF